MPDHDREDRASDSQRVEEQEQGDPEDDQRDHERAQQQRRDSGLPAEAAANKRDRGQDPEQDGGGTGERGDDCTGLERAPQVRIVRNWWYQWSVNPVSGNDGSAESLNEKISKITIGA